MATVFWALIIGLVFWLVGWAFGFKAFDAFLVTMLFLVIAISIRAVRPFLQRQLGR